MNRSDKFEDVRIIADAICNEAVTSEQVQHLESLLTNNKDAQQFYADYIAMHTHMGSPKDSVMEVVRRKLEIEEVIVRPAGSGNDRINQADRINNVHVLNTQQYNTVPLPNNTPPIKNTGQFPHLWLITLSIILIAIIITMTFNQAPSHYLGEITQGQLSAKNQGEIASGYLAAGQYKAEKASTIQLSQGEQISISKGSMIKFFNNAEIELEQGELKITPKTQNNLIIHGKNFTLNSSGSSLYLKLTDNVAEVTSGISTSIIPHRWRPRHFWPFESISDRAVDLAGNAHGIPSQTAKRVDGLIGSGAYEFDNSVHSRLNVGSGGGTAPATGTFAVTDGVTIEAIIKPKYSGKRGDQDIIFRKDQSDEDLRMLLSFQNDRGKNYLMPQGKFKESISFGLYLVGQGYHELKLPLDGKNGRPTLDELKQGKAHHLVATYQVSSGLKAIYLDGERLAYYQYPAGTKILSGGAGMANIGNTPNNIGNSTYKVRASGESYQGIIDEVAFYDFALPLWSIQQHFQLTQHGRNYFDLMPSSQDLPKRLNIPLTPNNKYLIDPLTGLPSRNIREK